MSGPGHEAAERRPDALDGAPPWIMPVIRRATWRVAGVVLIVTVLVIAFERARGLVGMLVIAAFFAMAMDPGVTSLNRRFGWRRGSATGVIFLGLVVFQFFTIAMFTFYFAAGAPKIRQLLLRRLPPDRQQRIGWSWDTAVQQTGGYFYSRLLLMLINGSLFFVVMLLVGVPWLIALPMSVFEGFVAEFIPAIGTYIGAAVPIVATLGLQGFVPALVLLGWTIVYQQVENYWLSPRISARTMEINGGVAFASALAGGAIAAPMGAFMALPVAAWVTSFLKQYGASYPLVYHSAYDDLPDDGAPADQHTTG